MDERYKDGFNYEDTDYFLTAKKLGIPFIDANVQLRNIGNATTQMYFADNVQALVNRNRQLFRDKWSVSC